MALNENIFGIANYYSLWSQSVAATLSQFANKEVTTELATAGMAEAEGERFWVTFTVSDALLGEQAFSVAKADVLHMGQMFIGEALNPAAEFTPDHADALAEVFRQFAGTVALQLKGILGTDCAIRFKDTEKPTWNSADESVLIVKTEPQITIAMKVDTGLLNSVTKVQLSVDEPQASVGPEAEQASQQAVEQSVQPAGSEPSVTKRVPIDPPNQLIEETLAQRKSHSTITDKNLDLLLDVELEVSIRFGKRQMLLKDVLELNSGALVELDRRVRDPIELLLDGKVIARGEAVIVDGNYGIRITEIISPSQRLAEIA